jgi:RNA polymerase sigma-70 factor, ECF subfamily
MATQTEHFETLLKEHERLLFKVVALYARHPEDRQELAQEIRMHLWRAFPSYRTETRFSTWMYRVALNVAISSLRRQKPAAASLSEASVAALSAPAPDERVAFLQGFLERLDSLDRALLALYLDGYSYAEIGEILGISETNVGTKISRLKLRIRKESEE